MACRYWAMARPRHQLLADQPLQKAAASKSVDKLVRLHNDVGYQRAIEELFQICTFEDASPNRRRRLPVLVAGVAAVGITVALMAVLLLR